MISTPPITTPGPEATVLGSSADIHDLKGLYPEDAGLAQWAEAVHQVYTEAKASVLPRAQAIAPS